MNSKNETEKEPGKLSNISFWVSLVCVLVIIGLGLYQLLTMRSVHYTWELDNPDYDLFWFSFAFSLFFFVAGVIFTMMYILNKRELKTALLMISMYVIYIAIMILVYMAYGELSQIYPV